MGASQCKVWYINCGSQGHVVWLNDLESGKPPVRVYVDGICVFRGDHGDIPEHGEILRKPLEGAALVLTAEKASKNKSTLKYTLQWDGQEYEDDLTKLKTQKNQMNLSDTYLIRLKAMEVRMEEAPVREGSVMTKSTAFFTIIANLYKKPKSGSKNSQQGQVPLCSGVSSHRFSALLDLHMTVGSYYRASRLTNIKLPKKPEKSVKGITGVSTSDADFIGHRKMEIDKWLQGIAKLPRLVYLPDFVQFFGLPSIRPKYCGSHIVFAGEATSLKKPAHVAGEKETAEAKVQIEENLESKPESDANDTHKEHEQDVKATEFETVDDFDDFATSPSKVAKDMEVPDECNIIGVKEGGLAMFGEQEDEEQEEKHEGINGHEISNSNKTVTLDKDNEKEKDISHQADEVTPIEKLLQAESKLSLFQQRLEQAEESQKHGLVDKLYVEIAKMQKTIFMLQEEAHKYEKMHAPSEAELWAGDEDDDEIKIEETMPALMDDDVSPQANRRSSQANVDVDEWGDFGADEGDEWGDGGDANDNDPFAGGALPLVPNGDDDEPW